MSDVSTGSHDSRHRRHKRLLDKRDVSLKVCEQTRQRAAQPSNMEYSCDALQTCYIYYLDMVPTWLAPP